MRSTLVPMNYTLHMGTSKTEAEEEEFVVFFLEEHQLVCMNSF